MKSWLIVVAVIFAMPAWAGIGTVGETRGTACEIQRGKAKLPGATGSEVESMDTYVTGACASSIIFRDDTRVKVNENSRLLIDDFVFDPRASDAGRLALKVGMGTVRYASGQIAKNNPQLVNIKTPTAAVTVRGTDFSMTVDEAGQSLVILVPSCRDEKEAKQYELDENRCRTGSIQVSNAAGTVLLDRPFEATFVASSTQAPTPPVVINIVESKINSNLLLVKPAEVQHAIKDANRTKQEKETEDMEAEVSRRMVQSVQKNSDDLEKTRIRAMTTAATKSGCNPAAEVCVAWERPDEPNAQARGRGIAYRNTEGEHYAEVKTLGYVSNTTVNITHNDAPASVIIGSGQPGGNTINIKQNHGLPRVRPPQ